MKQKIKLLSPYSREGFVLALALASVLLIAFFSYRGWIAFHREAEQVRATQRISAGITALVTALTEAETGQRGFLLTGDDRYLAVYSKGSANVPALLTSLESAAQRFPDQARRIEILKPVVNEKLQELALTIELEHTKGPEAALTVVRTDRGMRLMAKARAICVEMRTASNSRLAHYSDDAQFNEDESGLVSVLGCSGLFALLLVANITIQRGLARRQALIAELQDSRRRLLKTAVEAEAANRAKSRFLSTMSHEIRTPLNAILGYAQLMSRDPILGPDAKANLKIIGRSGEHLLTLINAVLDMSKIESGQTELHPVTFSLTKLLDDLAAMFRLRTSAKALSFEMLVDGESVPYVVADEGKIRQTLINLVGNAIKFTKRGHVKLHVHLSRKTNQSLWLSCDVEDTGVGMTEEDQEKVFEPFIQAKGEPNAQEGTGLGLAISREFARLMGGDLTVVSSPGVGSLFRLGIPVARGNAGIALQRTDPRRVIGIRAGTSAPRVLIADDLLENRDWLMKLLSTIGFSVLGADNGESAIRNWREWQPQMILMDIHMPVLDGLEATRRIKAEPRGADTIIVVLTASALEEDRLSVLATGADAFLTKPCQENELLEKMRTLLHIDYEYEETDEAETLAPPSPEELGSLPPALAEALRDATSDGNKRLLDQLIVQVREREADAFANTLQRLADRYDYDALTNLLRDSATKGAAP